MKRSFRQVNVFSSDPLLGNPLAVVHAADGLSEEQMAAARRLLSRVVLRRFFAELTLTSLA